MKIGIVKKWDQLKGWGFIEDLNDGYSIRFTADGNILGFDDSSQDKEFSILNAYPNPFNPTLNINYSLESSNHIILSIYDIKGQLIKTLLNAYQTSGQHQINWNSNGIAAGIYIIKLSIGSSYYSKKVILLK